MTVPSAQAGISGLFLLLWMLNSNKLCCKAAFSHIHSFSPALSSSAPGVAGGSPTPCLHSSATSGVPHHFCSPPAFPHCPLLLLKGMGRSDIWMIFIDKATGDHRRNISAQDLERGEISNCQPQRSPLHCSFCSDGEGTCFTPYEFHCKFLLTLLCSTSPSALAGECARSLCQSFAIFAKARYKNG